MIKYTFPLACGILFSSLALFAADAPEPSPLTPAIQAKLRSDVVTIVAEGFLTPEGVAKVKAEGWAYVSRSRREPGCIQYQLQEDIAEPGHILFYEQYASPAAFNTHVTSEYSKAWVNLLKPVSTKPIVIHFVNKIEHLAEK